MNFTKKKHLKNYLDVVLGCMTGNNVPKIRVDLFIQRSRVTVIRISKN